MTDVANMKKLNIVPNKSDYRNFADFCQKHIKKKENNLQITNTRIGDAKQSIHGGSFHIPDAEYKTFISLYYSDIVSSKKKEYLTEKQLETNGPLLVDVDLRHSYEVDERLYTNDHLFDMIQIHLEELKQIYQFDDATAFKVYVLEKATVNRVKEKNYTKDGIHIIFGIQSNPAIQQILRKRVIPKVQIAWSDLPITNSFDDVFDEGISKGTTNWQLFYSRKPGHERYNLTQVYNVSIDPADEEIITKEISISKINMETEIYKLSARYKDHPKLFMRNNFVDEFTNFINKNNSPRNTNSTKTVLSSGINELQHRTDILDDVHSISNIKNQEELDLVLNNFIEVVSETTTSYNLKTIYDYTMILPVSYYGEGSYDKWKRVGWALRNTSNKLLIVWIAFSAKSNTFSFSNIPDLCNLWRNFECMSHGGLTRLSLIHWAKMDAPEEFEIVQKNSVDYYVEHTINNFGVKDKVPDFDLANVLHQLYKHEYVCVSISNNKWYRYKDHRWIEDDSGTSLRLAISRKFRALYNAKSANAGVSLQQIGQTQDLSQEEEDKAMLAQKNRTMKVLKISNRLGQTQDKNNILKEAKELFYNDKFLEQLDTNPYLLCFNNGVIDFKTNTFRKGQPEDNISLCTNINYIPIDYKKHNTLIQEINKFMDQLFPDKELCRYMWEHLASALIGTAMNQKFNNYIGNGSNGKSVLIGLMTLILGDYKGEVPTTLITEKRSKVGGLTPEIVQLKGIRYAVMQEPSKNEQINEGMMKELTSGKDALSGRAPYMPKTISFIPQFTLVLACNDLMKVNATDYGTWRRIRAVPFMSLFTLNPVQGDKEKPYQFMLDEKMDERFEDWKEVFMSLLVNIVYKTEGKVTDCDKVLERSKEYAESQDYIAEFINDRITKDSNGKIKQTELNQEFSVWYFSNYGTRPKGTKELHEYMNKKFGRKINLVWKGAKINYENSNTNAEDSDNDDIDIHNDI